MVKAKSKQKRKPVRYSPAVADRIVKRLSSGETLRSITLRSDMPHWTAVYQWMDNDEDFAQRIARAREVGHDAIAEECVAIAENPVIGQTVETRSGSNPGRTIKKGDMVERAKLKIWTRLQLLAKWNPKKYGERTAIDMNVKSDVADRLAAGRKRVSK